ncbi:MAG: glycosyltransferase family 4 protein [Candidatus Andersenbacteria bacterium]
MTEKSELGVVPSITTKPLRVVCLTRAYGQHAGGMERLSFELIESLKTDASLNVEVIAYQGKRALSPLFIFSCLPRLWRYARQADIVHLGDPLLSFSGWVVRKLTGVPVVVTVHGLDVTYNNPLYQLYLRLFFRNFAGYVPISRYVQTLLRPLGLAQKSRVIAPGVHDRFWRPVPRAALDTLLPATLRGKRILFTSGRLVRRKGHQWFIEEVLPHLPNSAVYVIAGDGPERKHIIEAAAQRGVAARVCLLGRVPDEELRILLNTVDAFVQPNITVTNDVEGFGLVLLEAALCERPVFVAAHEGMTDAIIQGKNGVLLPVGNAKAWQQALRIFLQEPKRHTPSGSQTRAYTKTHFTWDERRTSYRDYFKQLDDGPP